MKMPIAFGTVTTFMHKGIECIFSEKANELISHKAHKMFLLESFFAAEPINSIKWVDLKVLEDQNSQEQYLPMYRIGNADHELILWPFLRGSDLVIGVECSSERPDLADLEPSRFVR